MIKLAQLVLVLILLVPVGGCAGAEAAFGFIDLFLGEEEEPEKTETEKWIEKQQKKNKEPISQPQKQQVDTSRRWAEYHDCRQQYFTKGSDVLREKCDGLKP